MLKHTEEWNDFKSKYSSIKDKRAMCAMDPEYLFEGVFEPLLMGKFMTFPWIPNLISF